MNDASVQRPGWDAKRAERERVLKREFTPRQKEALASTARHLLFGGGAGGGKTDWACFDAMGHNNPGGGLRAIDFPDYTALFLRRTVKQLEDVIRRTKKYYPVWGKDPKTGEEPIFREQKKVWVFPSGAQIFFGYIDRTSDVENYQGWQYHAIYFEELTQWPSSYPYEYLHGRLRQDEDSPIHVGMKATCNPGGVGHHWVRAFWQIDNEGNPNIFSVPTEIVNPSTGEKKIVDVVRQFIPALYTDNRFINQEQYAISLSGLSPQMRRAWEQGRWDVVDLEGVVYADQIKELHQRGAIRDVPYDPRYPVNTFWDIGITDKVAIWFHQRVDGVDRFIDYYEAANRGLKDHWRELQGKRYNYGVHFRPHDAGHRRHNAGGAIMTINDIMEDLGMKNLETVPKVPSIQQGIEQTRIVMPACVFDWGGCERGIQCLSNYRFKRKEDGSTSLKPVHDEWSHGADAFRQFAQAFDLIEDAISEATNVEAEVPDVPWARKNHRKVSRRRWLV